VKDRWITDWEPSVRFPHYTRANSGEVLPEPASPLGWSYAWEHGICLGWRDGYVRVGAYDRAEFDPVHPDVCGSFGGYMYINLSTVRMQAVRSPVLTVEQLDMAFFGNHPDVPRYVPKDGDDRPDLVPGIERHMGWVMTADEWPELLADRDEIDRLRAARPDLTALDAATLLARAREIQPRLVYLFDQHTVTSSSSGIAPGVLFAIGEVIGDPSMAMRVLAALGDVDSAEPSYALWDLSRRIGRSGELTAAFDQGVDGLLGRLEAADTQEARAFVESWREFIARFGARGPNEWDMRSDTWETRPEIALAALDRVRFQRDDESPRARSREHARDREKLTAEVRDRLADQPELLAQFEAALHAANMMAWRERTKTNIVKALHEARMVFRELGRREAQSRHLIEPGHIFMLLDDELEAFIADPGLFRDELAARAADYLELFELEPPFIIADGAVRPLGEWPRRGSAPPLVASSGTVLHGVPGGPGSASGRARVVLDPSDPGALGPGDILVAPLTDPAWTPLFMAAGGVVVDVGGQISHAIIVCRELGLPCAVSVTDATRRLPDGAMITVDGDTGTVTVH